MKNITIGTITQFQPKKDGVMSAHLDSQKRMQVIGAGILVVAFVGFLGAYFWTSYRAEQAQISIQEKMLSFHDDLLGIHRGTVGQAWVVGKYGLILHTIDGGRNWEKQTSGTTQTLAAVSFADDRVGFVVGTGGTILTTSNGGLSWAAIQNPTRDYLLGVQALDKNKVCAVGAFGTFLSTSDQGRTWKKYEFPWERLMSPIAKEFGGKIEPNLNSVHFITPEIGWTVGEFGLILHTRDGGRTWALQRSGSKLAPLFAVIFHDERRGWAMGQGGTLIWTKDAGQHWFPSKREIGRDLYAATVEGERAVVVGDRVFLKTENGGSTWTQRDFTENLVLNDVAFMSKGATVVGQHGVIRIIE
jgi:photosystem II stability/assembly factor-like uncharacterized protein